MRKTSFSRRSCFLVLGVAIGAVSPSGVALAQQPSSSDIAQARTLFNQGMRLREKGDALGALEKLKSANALGHTPITGLELGRTYEQVGKLVEAREALLSVARIPVHGAETARSTAARTESVRLAEQLRPRIPTLTVKVSGVSATAVTVTVDGVTVPPEALDAPRPANPGTHEVSALSTDAGTDHVTVVLKEGEVREAELKIAVVSAPLSPAAEPRPARQPDGVSTAPPPASGTSPVVYIGVGLAGAGLVVGSITGGMAMSKASSVKGACNGTMCPRSVDDDLQSGRTLGNVSNAAFIAAAAGAVVGVVGLVLSHHPQEAAPKATLGPWVTPGVGGLQGTF